MNINIDGFKKVNLGFSRENSTNPSHVPGGPERESGRGSGWPCYATAVAQGRAAVGEKRSLRSCGALPS